MLRAILLVAFLAAAANAQIKAPRIDVLNTAFTLDKGFKQVVEFRLDEPIICPQADRECAVVITITNSHPSRVTMDTCIIKWLWNEWHQSRFLTVAAIENFVNDQALTVTLKTEPAISRSEYYSGFDAKDIILTAKPRPSADCSGTGDPHYVTFDGYYWHVYYAGRYVVYKSLIREFEVQVETYAYPARHCAFAAKEGNDIVVVNACSGIAKHRRSCGTQECLNGGFPKVGITGGGSSATYVVSFKSGAQVRGDFSGQYMNFYCTAPGIDYGQTAGICGNFNGKSNDDAPIYVAQSPNDLWASQKPTRDLFAWYPSGPITPLDAIPPHAVKCEYIEPTFIRPILNNPDVEDITNLIKSGNPKDTTGGNFVVNPTVNYAPIDETQARLQCETTIKNSVVAKTCQRVIANFPIQDYILDCVDDLVQTGDVSFIEDALDAMQAVCASVGNKDQTTWELDNNGQPVEPSKQLQQTLCPNGCSGHGVCDKSQCRCDDGYSGVDCSINKAQPPVVTGITDPFCDSRGLKPCPREINVHGSNFWNSDNLACYFDGEQTRALYLGSQEVLCALPKVAQAGGTTVTRRVYVGTDFKSKESAVFTWYDSVCSVCTNLAGCAPNPESCTIDGVCYLATQAKPDNVCLQCQPTKSNSTWSYTYTSRVDCGPNFELVSYTAKIVSEVPLGYEVIRMSAANALVAGDSKNTITYSITGESAFTINAKTGVITTTRALKASDIGIGFNNLISVTATDSAGNFAQTTVVVVFVQTNQSPVFKLDGYFLNVTENSPIGTKVGQITAEDKDANPDWSSLTYEWFSLEQGHETDFNVNPSDGTITVGAPIDFETKKSYELHLKAKDGGNQFHVTTVTITVINVNEPPTKISLSNNAVEENKPVGTVVGDLTSEDPEGGPFTYTVDNANFKIVGSKLVTAAMFNFEAVNKYTVNIKSTDPTGMSLTLPFTINVIDVNEKPYGIALASTTFDEDAKVDSILTTITVKDDDAKQTVGCSLADSFGMTFEISGRNLILLKPLDFESKLAYKIVVVCADDGTPVLQSDPATFTFTIIDKNDAPENVVMNTNGGRIPEDAKVGAVVGTITAVDNDKDAGDIKFTLGADNTKFILGTPKCTKNATTGAVTCSVDVILQQPLDFETDKTEVITVTATDNKGLNSVTKLNIPVSNVNEAPKGVEWIDGKNKVMEGSVEGTVIGQLKAIDEDADEPGATFQFELIGGDGIIALRQARRAISGPVVTVVVADQSMLDFETHPTVPFQIKVTDAGGLSVIANAVVVVLDEPVIMWADTAKNNEFTVTENSPVGTVVAKVVVTGFDRQNDLKYTLSLADDSKGQFAISGDSITVAGPIDYETATSGFIQVKATYSRLNPASNVAIPPADVSRINFQVKNVAEPPYFTANKYKVIVSDDENVGTSLKVEPAIMAIDPESKAVTYTISASTNPKGIFTIRDDGIIRIAKMPSVAGVAPGTYPVEVVAFDGTQTTPVIVLAIIQDGCTNSPCQNGAMCKDEFNGYTCVCANGFGGDNCESAVTLQSGSGKNSTGSVAGIVVGCIVGILLVLIVLFVVFRRRSDGRRDTEAGLLMSKENHFAHNPTFIDPSAVDSRSPEYAPVVRFVPGVANPIYDWYQPDMNRNECNDYLMSQGEGAFVVRDSKATPGWHMLGVKSNNQVIHDKIRMNEDGTYSLIPTTSNRAQPSFPDIPSLVQYYAANKTDVQYALAFSNPIYDNHLMKNTGSVRYASSSSAAPILPNDPAAPAVPLKQREMHAVHALASQDSEDIYTNTEEAKLAVSNA